MYDPKGNGKDKAAPTVMFNEAEPPDHLRGVVHRFLELRTPAPLVDDYRFHALPDACTYIVFDQRHPEIAGVTRLRASSEELNLGKMFHFVNVRFLPGVWQGNRDQICHGIIKDPYGGDLPLLALNKTLIAQDFEGQSAALSQFVEELLRTGQIIANPVTEKIFQHIDEIHAVADMAAVCALSPRQLQRVLQRTTGFAPHDFLKVLRLQQSLEGEPSVLYADQSHFIHSLRKATGYTPGQYARKFDV
ncbi:helix-turn-helix transcriptional regulator [Actibacterium sp. 188UL27-1]|nr:helix-turn-helix transcriptional regulator [Actibacterium sp. 188UL27-1]